MKNTEQLYLIHKKAVEYIDKIGTPQWHLGEGSVGKISKLKVETEVNYQSSPGSTNYWGLTAFDEALSEVIKKNFQELAQAALDLLQNKADESLVAEKKELQERLAKIEELEKQGA